MHIFHSLITILAKNMEIGHYKFYIIHPNSTPKTGTEISGLLQPAILKPTLQNYLKQRNQEIHQIRRLR